MSLRVGVIGLGSISRGHVASWPGVKGATFAAVCDMDKERAAEVGNKLGIPWYSSAEEMYEKENIAAVDLCLPPHAHAPVALDALRRGIHVLVEKPIAINSELAQEMIDASRASGCVLGTISQLRFSSHVGYLRKLLMDGTLGKPLAAHVELKTFMGWNMYQTTDKTYLASRERSGGGVLAQNGIHHIDMLRYLLGDVKQVTWARVENLAHSGTDVEDYSVAHLLMENGAHCIAESSSIWPPTHRQTRITISTTRCTVVLERDRIVSIDALGEEQIPIPEDVPGVFMLQMQDFVDAIQSGRSCLVTGVEGARALAVVEAIYQAGLDGGPVDVRKVND